MRALTVLFGLAPLAIVVADAFQTVIVARHAQKLPAITRALFRLTWVPVAAAARLVKSNNRRENYLGFYGPLSLLLLLGFWASGLILAFAILQWSADLHLGDPPSGFANDTYFSAATFFTLGAGEPRDLPSKYLMVLEGGFGFSFLGLVIGYLPVLYPGILSPRISYPSAGCAGRIPPSAVELIRRRGNDPEKLEKRLVDWEEWRRICSRSHVRASRACSWKVFPHGASPLDSQRPRIRQLANPNLGVLVCSVHRRLMRTPLLQVVVVPDPDDPSLPVAVKAGEPARAGVASRASLIHVKELSRDAVGKFHRLHATRPRHPSAGCDARLRSLPRKEERR